MPDGFPPDRPIPGWNRSARIAMNEHSWGKYGMFLTELSPLMRDCLTQPIAFVGGLVTGALRLNLQDEPLRSWLARQGAGSSAAGPSVPTTDPHGPQSIEID
jgi:hypothetical protein